MIWFIIIIVLIVLIVLYVKFRPLKDATILCFSGQLGGGKTFNLTQKGLKLWNKSKWCWRKGNWKICKLPILHKLFFKKYDIYEGLDKPCLYSNYPMVNPFFGIGKNKVVTKPLTNDIMFMRKTIPYGSIVVLDEFSSWINQFEFNKSYSACLNDHIQKFRHYHGNHSHLLVADQCTNNIPIQVRYRLNSSVCCLSTRHYFKFIHVTKYRTIDLTDDVKSVNITSEQPNVDDNDNIGVKRAISFGFSRCYDDTTYSNRYAILDGGSNCKFIDSPLKTLGTLPHPDVKEQYLDLDEFVKEFEEKKVE